MTVDEGKTHYVGDGCQPAHDPAIDQAPDKIEVPCSGCSTDPCYHWPYCTELLSLRAQVERTERTMKAHREVAVAAIAGTEKQLIEVRAALTAALEQNERFDKRYRDAEAEVERLTVELTHRVGWEERCLNAEAALARLRAVLDEIAAEDDE